MDKWVIITHLLDIYRPVGYCEILPGTKCMGCYRQNFLALYQIFDMRDIAWHQEILPGIAWHQAIYCLVLFLYSLFMRRDETEGIISLSRMKGNKGVKKWILAETFRKIPLLEKHV